MRSAWSIVQCAVRLMACGALLALAARAQPVLPCTYTRSGHLAGRAYRLPVTYLTSGPDNWEVTVPIPAECALAGAPAAGWEALVCDHYAPPVVRADRDSMRVLRTPCSRSYTTVQITVYCVFRYSISAPNMVPVHPYKLPAQTNMLPPKLNVLPPQTNLLPPQPNKLPAHPITLQGLLNRFQNMTEPILPSTTPTAKQSNDSTLSIVMTKSPDLSLSSSEEEIEKYKPEEEPTATRPEDKQRLLQWRRGRRTSVDCSASSGSQSTSGETAPMRRTAEFMKFLRID